LKNDKVFENKKVWIFTTKNQIRIFVIFGGKIQIWKNVNFCTKNQIRIFVIFGGKIQIWKNMNFCTKIQIKFLVIFGGKIQMKIFLLYKNVDKGFKNSQTNKLKVYLPICLLLRLYSRWPQCIHARWSPMLDGMKKQG